MAVWILLVGYILFVKAAMGPLLTDKARKKYLLYAGTATFLVMGLRGGHYANVYDLRVYRSFYETIMDTPWTEIFTVSGFEPGYALLNKILSVILPFSQAIVLFEAGFCVFCVCYFIYRNADDVFWPFYFYVTLGSMGFMLTGLRQAIAICVCLLGVELIKKGKGLRFLAVTLLAYSIHRSALVFVALYFVARSKIVMRKRWVLVLVVILMMIFAPSILQFGKLISQDELVAAEEAVYSFNGIVPILIYIAGLWGQIITDGRHEDKRNECLVLSPMLAIGLGLYLMRFYNTALERLALYYTQASYICLSRFFDIWKKDRSVVPIKILVIILGFLLFYKRLQTADYAAYTFFWN